MWTCDYKRNLRAASWLEWLFGENDALGYYTNCLKEAFYVHRFHFNCNNDDCIVITQYWDGAVNQARWEYLRRLKEGSLKRYLAGMLLREV